MGFSKAVLYDYCSKCKRMYMYCNCYKPKQIVNSRKRKTFNSDFKIGTIVYMNGQSGLGKIIEFKSDSVACVKWFNGSGRVIENDADQLKIAPTYPENFKKGSIINEKSLVFDTGEIIKIDKNRLNIKIKWHYNGNVDEYNISDILNKYKWYFDYTYCIYPPGIDKFPEGFEVGAIVKNQSRYKKDEWEKGLIISLSNDRKKVEVEWHGGETSLVTWNEYNILEVIVSSEEVNKGFSKELKKGQRIIYSPYRCRDILGTIKRVSNDRRILEVDWEEEHFNERYPKIDYVKDHLLNPNEGLRLWIPPKYTQEEINGFLQENYEQSAWYIDDDDIDDDIDYE